MTTLAKANYPFVSWLMTSVAGFVLGHHRKRASHREFEYLAPEDVSAIARDLKLSKASLKELAGHKKETPQLLVRMLAALNKAMPPSADLLSRDMETVCSLCRNQQRCQRELSRGSAAANYSGFCPNAYNLDFLPRQEGCTAP